MPRLENLCSGCTRCTCSASGEWSCNKIIECNDPEKSKPVNDESLDNALNVLFSELKNKDKNKPLRIDSVKSSEDLLLGKDDEIERKIIELMSRQKRSVSDDISKENETIQFHHTIDEINEDTLNNTNITGTLHVKKVEAGRVPKISRRTGMLLNGNISSNPLHIEYNRPHTYLTDNKIDATTPIDEINNLLIDEKTIRNYTQKDKDKELSKIVVNELKPGSEVIGGKNDPIMSNITFTSENDTLTAMAYIAGNLLNKLWSMEKYTSDESIETEDLKHEKITDLLDLFKEPLSLRQEAFLKDALERLSEAIDKNKDTKNITLCENIEEAKKFLQEAENSPWEKTEIKTPEKNTSDQYNKKDGVSKNNATHEAISKINNVLDLIHKFEGVNKHLSSLREGLKESKKKHDGNLRSQRRLNDSLDDKENASLNLFGNVLEKITKLLLPSKSSKKMINKIRSQSIFGNSENLKKQIKDTYNYDLGNLTMTTKDKLVLDYLTKIKNCPSCLDNLLRDDQSTPSIEGDILLNLSEFFKIKSFVDLMKLLEKETEKPPQVDINLRSLNIETEKPLDKTTTVKLVTISPITENPNTLIFANTKEKLKMHLKTILDDLVELQNEKGIPTKEGEIHIADALPCIYKILNANGVLHSKILNDETYTNPEVQHNILNDEIYREPADKIAAVFDTIKKETQLALTRRSNLMDIKPRAKSAVVWERIVKSIDARRKLNTRRNMQPDTIKSFDELQTLIDRVESSNSNLYKNYAVFFEVPAANRLALLRTVDTDIRQYVSILQKIKTSIDILDTLGVDERKIIGKFIENANTRVNVCEIIIKNLEKPKEEKDSSLNPYSMKTRRMNTQIKEEMKQSKFTGLNDFNKNIKLSREEILNQLIRNRVQSYLQLKEAKADYNRDPNYNIAKAILSNLEKGNNRLAKELYKVFVSTNNLRENNAGSFGDTAILKSNAYETRRESKFNKIPLIQFQEPKVVDSYNQFPSAYSDHMVKQLLNMKNMK